MILPFPESMLCYRHILRNFVSFSQIRSGSNKNFEKRQQKAAFSEEEEYHRNTLTEEQKEEYSEFMRNVSHEGLKEEATKINMKANKNRGFVRKMQMRKLYMPEGPVQPNLLTWAMKQNIKSLNETNPNLWTLKALAKSFPSNEEGIQKVLKSKRGPGGEKNRKKHDSKVAKNWSVYANNKLGSSRLLAKSVHSKFNQYSPTTDLQTITGAPNLNKVTGLMKKMRDSQREEYFRKLDLVHPVHRKKMENFKSFRSIISEYNNGKTKEDITTTGDKMADPISIQELGDDSNLDTELDQHHKYVKIDSKFSPKKNNRFLTFEQLKRKRKEK